MSRDESTRAAENTRLTVEIVSGYLKRYQIAANQLANLISTVHDALVYLGKSPQKPTKRTPAVSRRRSVQRDLVICLDCGFRGQTLRRHLGRRHGLTVGEYRRRWDLSPNHPITAPAYSERRSGIAKRSGFGGREAAVLPRPSARLATAAGSRVIERREPAAPVRTREQKA